MSTLSFPLRYIRSHPLVLATCLVPGEFPFRLVSLFHRDFPLASLYIANSFPSHSTAHNSLILLSSTISCKIPFRLVVLIINHFSPPHDLRLGLGPPSQPVSQPTNSRNQLTASSCCHGSLNVIVFRRVDFFAFPTLDDNRMLGNFVGYLFGSNYSGTQDSLEEDPRTRGIMRRFRQVEVEDDEWILIDRTVEGTLEEPWYEMPPAVFTQEGPVKVATSPMENLLIEHPSMSVYSVVSGTMTSPIAPDTPPPSPDGGMENQKDIGVLHNTDVLQEISATPPADLSSSTSTLRTMSTSLNSSSDRSNIDELSRRVVAELQAIHNDRLSVSDSNNNRARIGNQLRSAQERAQEMLKKRTTQNLKKARLERNNKVRQTKGKRLRRQDRLRVCHSGANNNRKC